MNKWRDVKDPVSLVRGLGAASLDVEAGVKGAARTYDELLGQILRVGRAEAVRIRMARAECGTIDVRKTRRGDPPTRSQERLLRFIAQWIAEKNYAPSTRETMLGIGVGSTNAVTEQVARLVLKGFLACEPRMARSIRVTAEGYAVLALKETGNGETEAREAGAGVARRSDAGASDPDGGDASGLRGRVRELSSAS